MNPEYFMVDCQEKREGCEGQRKIYFKARKRTPPMCKSCMKIRTNEHNKKRNYQKKCGKVVKNNDSLRIAQKRSKEVYKCAKIKPKRSTRTCRRCGEDPAPNYFFCPSCHMEVSQQAGDTESCSVNLGIQ
uniref:Uncharacterized protein n=1 Tax=Candidatus Desulfatibia profunda TaxID=2841695 RepID=A0A8J6TL18_9BACT|nr:hypothetical protein [Candidatus Desulfatibia profunda]